MKCVERSSQRAFSVGAFALRLLACTLGVLIASANTARAQIPSAFLGEFSETEKAEVTAWCSYYWQRQDGQIAPGAAEFQFSSETMRSPLFNPLRMARPTLEKVGVIGASDCDGLASSTTDVAAASAQVRDALRKLMLEAKIETSASSQPQETINHVELILAAPAESGVSVWTSGDKIISLDLPLEKVSKPAYAAAISLYASSETQQLIAAILTSSGQWAQDAVNRGGVSEWKTAVTGNPSRATIFRDSVDLFLMATSSSPLRSQIAYAQFGVTGELPIVIASFPECVLLLDPLTGNAAGPFERTSTLDGRLLLSAHPEVGTMIDGIKYFSEKGCPIDFAVGIPYPGSLPAPWKPIVWVPGIGWGPAGAGGGWSPWTVFPMFPGTGPCMYQRTRNMGKGRAVPICLTPWTCPMFYPCMGLESEFCISPPVTGPCPPIPPVGCTCTTISDSGLFCLP